MKTIQNLNERVEKIMRGEKTGELFVREGIEHVDGSAKQDIESQIELPERVAFLRGIRTEKTAVRAPNSYPVLLRYHNH